MRATPRWIGRSLAVVGVCLGSLAAPHTAAGEAASSPDDTAVAPDSTVTTAGASASLPHGAGVLPVLREDGRQFVARRTGYILVSGAALTAASLAREDPDRTEELLSGTTWEHVADLGNLYGNGATLGIGALALFATGSWSGHRNLRATGWDAVRSLGYTYAIVSGLKIAVERTRPDGGRHSFPSGHTAGAFAIAPVLARHLGLRAALPAYALALATSVGRLEDRKHFLSDVVFGAALGTSVGAAVSRSGGEESRVGVSFDRCGVRVAVGF